MDLLEIIHFSDFQKAFSVCPIIPSKRISTATEFRRCTELGTVCFLVLNPLTAQHISSLILEQLHC